MANGMLIAMQSAVMGAVSGGWCDFASMPGVLRRYPVIDDDPSLMDIEQGVPHLKGVPCRVTKLSAAELALYGKGSLY